MPSENDNFLEQVIKQGSVARDNESRLRRVQVFPQTITGWSPYINTWYYNNATSISVGTGDITAYFPVGTRIRLKQGGGFKYFYVVGAMVSGGVTYLTITGGSDYSLEVLDISDPYYSYVLTPQGFPDWFNWTPTFSGFSANPAGAICRFSIKGKECIVVVSMPSGGGTSDATTFTMTGPCTASSAVSFNAWGGRSYYSVDNGGAVDALAFISYNSNVINLWKSPSAHGWTASGEKRADFTIIYEI